MMSTVMTFSRIPLAILLGRGGVFVCHHDLVRDQVIWISLQARNQGNIQKRQISPTDISNREKYIMLQVQGNFHFFEN